MRLPHSIWCSRPLLHTSTFPISSCYNIHNIFRPCPLFKTVKTMAGRWLCICAERQSQDFGWAHERTQSEAATMSWVIHHTVWSWEHHWTHCCPLSALTCEPLRHVSALPILKTWRTSNVLVNVTEDCKWVQVRWQWCSLTPHLACSSMVDPEKTRAVRWVGQMAQQQGC